MTIHQLCWTLLSTMTCHEILLSRSLNRSEAPLLKSGVMILLLAFFPSSQGAEFHSLMVTAPKFASNFYMPDQFFLVVSVRSRRKPPCHQHCFGLAWIKCQVPTKAAVSLPLLSGQRRRNTVKGSWIEIGTGRDHSPITVTGRTD